MNEILISIVRELDKIKYKKKAQVLVNEDLFLFINNNFYVIEQEENRAEIKIGAYYLEILKDDTKDFYFKIIV